MKDPDRLTEYARQNLSRTMTSHDANAEGMVPVISLDPLLDRQLAEVMRPSGGGESSGVSPSFLHTFVNSARQAIERVVTQGYQPILLCSQTIRAHVYRLVSPGVHALAVLFPNEPMRLMPRPRCKPLKL